MKSRGLTGSRIRERRLSLGMKQAELARLAGVSASYLNLIEHNKRPIAGKVLGAIGAALQVDAALLSEGANAGFIEELRGTAGAQGEVDRVEELAGRFPGWAAQLVEQARQIEILEERLQAQDDQLTHDPVLSERMQDVLAAVAAIRSTSSILVDTPDINAEWRARFHSNIDKESRRLAESSAAMAAQFDQLLRDGSGSVAPLEAVAKFLEARRYQLPEIEEGGAGAIDAVLAEAEALDSPAARELGQSYLAMAARDADALPLTEFAQQARAAEFEPAALAERLNAPLTLVFRRLAALPLQAETPDFGLVSCDSAGGILFRKPCSGFALPRSGAPCALWPLFEALHSPHMPIQRRIETPEGAQYDAYAIAERQGAAQFGQPALLRAYMLLVAREEGGEADDQSLPVGPTCRVCPRTQCVARREPSALSGPLPSLADVLTGRGNSS